ncbi:MAG: FecR domain-containing protein, partial [Alphaproteobacteria bacterium]
MAISSLNSDAAESSADVQVLQAENGSILTVPGDSWLLKADFAPQGSDLLLTGPDGSQVLVRDFFSLDSPPDLVTEAGGVIPAELAVRLAGPTAPGQFAMLQNGPFVELAQAVGEPIGKVEATDGLVEATHIDGTRVTLAKGDNIYEGDTLETAKGAAVGITFIDDTTFSLGEEGRMVIDEMVYDPDTHEGQFNANLVQGVFSFVSGEIAKASPDAMTLTTPVATIGIRGTKVAGHAAQEGSQNTISLLPEINADGSTFVGELFITNQGGTVTLNSIGATVQMSSAFSAPPPPVFFSPQQIQQNFGSTLTNLSASVAARAEANAAEDAAEAEQAQAQAEQAGAQAEEAQAEADAAQAEAEAARAAAEATGDAGAIAEAEAAEAAAEAAAAEAEIKAQEAEVAQAEAEAAEVQAEQAQAQAEQANNEMQAQAQAFAAFGASSPDGPADGDAPADSDASPDNAPQTGDGDAPSDDQQQADEGDPLADGDAFLGGADIFLGGGDTLTGDGGLLLGDSGDDTLDDPLFSVNVIAPMTDDNPPPDDDTTTTTTTTTTETTISPINTTVDAAATLDGAAVTLTGGQGSDDTLTLINSNSVDLDATELANISAWETWTLGSDEDWNLALADANIASGETLTINTSALTDGQDAVIDASLETDGTLTFIGGDGADSLTVAMAMMEGAAASLDGNGMVDDNLYFYGTGNLDATELGNVTDFETWTFSDSDGITLTMAEANVASGATLTINANLDGAAATVDASAETDGTINYNGDGGVDTLTVHQAMLTGATATLTGGGSSDALKITGGGTLISGELANVTAWETWYLLTDSSYDITLNTANAGTGALTIDATAITTSDYFELNASAETDSGSTITLAINDSVLFGTQAALVGGSGSDTLSISSTGVTLSADALSNVTAWETWTLATDADYNLTTAAGNVASTKTLAINASAVAAGSTATIDATLETDGEITYVGGAGVDNLTVATAMLDDGVAHSLDGNDGTDTLTFVGTGDLDSEELSAILDFETWTLTGDVAYTLGLSANNVAIDKTLTIDASNVTSAAVIVSAGAETDGTINYTGGGGDDTLTVHQVMMTGAVAALTGGGGSSDTLTITGGGTLLEAEMASVSGWETLTLGTNASTSITLNTANAGTGALIVNTSIISTTGNLVKFDASAETDGGTVTLNIKDAVLDTTAGTAAILTGGSGSDTLTLSGGGRTLDATELGSISGWETWSLLTSSTYNLTLADANIAASATLTIDGSAAAGVTVNASAELDGNLTFTGSTSDDTLTVNGARLDATNHTLTAGSTSTGDTLNITSTGTLSISSAAQMAGITGFDSMNFSSNVAYTIRLNDANIASTKTMAIDASAASASTLYGAAEADGYFTYVGSAGTDYIQVGTMLDGQTLSMTGGGGTDDTIQISGSATLSSGELEFITGWDKFYLQSATSSYDVTLHADNANGSSLEVYGASSSVDTTFVIDGSAETTETLILTGGGNADTLTGGGGADT